MKEDQQTYKRATTAALLGLAVQFVLFLALLGLGMWDMTGSVAVSFEAYHAAGGLFIWLMLALIYQQHRLERLESLETEQLANRHGTDSSIFETSADDLAIARHRLKRFHKYGLPTVSLLTSAYLIGMGFVLFQTGLLYNKWLLVEGDPSRDLLAEMVRHFDKQGMGLDDLSQLLGMAVSNVWLAVTVFGMLAFVGFIASRYLAGMTKVKQWILLRGGAGYLMGNVLMTLLLILAYGANSSYFNSPSMLRWMMVIVPVFMMIIGVEILFTFILDHYRPKKLGEIPRPSFDSRLLGLLTTPESITKTISETINYQFGFEVTHSWFWQLFSKSIGYLVIFGALVLMALSSIVIVASHEQAVVVRFGRLVSEKPLESGLHFKLPWPFATTMYYQVDRIQTIVSGSDVELIEVEKEPAVLWTNKHFKVDPVSLIVAPAVDQSTDDPDADQNDSSGKAPTISLVNAEIEILWHISDLIEFVKTSNKPVRVLKNLSDLEVSRYLYTQNIDAWIGASRIKAGHDLTKLIQEAANRVGLGIEIIAVTVKSIHPPQQVADAFHETVGAQQEKIQAIQGAQQEAIKTRIAVAGSTAKADALVALIQKRNTFKTQGDVAGLDNASAELEKQLRNAGGEAAKVIAQSRAYRWSRENTERAQAKRYEVELLGYQQAPRLYTTRKYLEVLSEGLVDSRKYLLLSEREDLILKFDFKDATGMGSIVNSNE